MGDGVDNSIHFSCFFFFRYKSSFIHSSEWEWMFLFVQKEEFAG